MQALQEKVSEQNTFIEAHRQPPQAQNSEVNLGKESHIPLWRPYEDIGAQALEVEREVDECIQNIQCEADCTHGACKTNPNKEEKKAKVTCHYCKKTFSDKITMMDHKRDSDHPSKRKCNQFPERGRESQCALPRQPHDAAQSCRKNSTEPIPS